MTRIILDINDNKKLKRLLNFVQELGISVQQETISIIKEEEKNKWIENIQKGVSFSSFGDASEYQREIRKDRKLPFRDKGASIAFNKNPKLTRLYSFIEEKTITVNKIEIPNRDERNSR